MNLKKSPHQGKSWLATAALVSLSAATTSAQIVAGWDTYSGTGADAIPVDAPVVATGITASLVTTGEGRTWVTIDERGASSDGTWGTYVGPPAADTTVGTNNDQNLELSNAATGGTISMTITNNSGEDIDLNAFHMDALAFRPKAARTYTLDVQPGGAITAGNVYTSGDQEIKSQGGLPPDNDQGDDIDHDLNNLADSTLENGGTVEFILTFSGGAGDSSGGHDLWIDNLAISSNSTSADQLAITAAPASATAGENFSITVQAQDGNGAPLAGGVTQDTVVALTTPGGIGTLTGNTATILSGTNSITFTTAQYTAAEDITLVASQTSGDLLVQSAESTIITFIAGPASVLSVESANDGSGTAIGNASFRINNPADTLDIYAVSRDSVGNFIAFETGAVFTLENITGALVAGDLMNNGGGNATFTAQNLGTGMIRASVANLPDGDSGLITVEESQFRWIARGNGSWGASTGWLDNNPPIFDNTTDLFFMDEIATTAQTFLNGDRTVRSLNFTKFANPTVTQPALGIRYTQNGSNDARNLTFDTDSRNEPAEIIVDAETDISINLGNVNIPLNADDYGDTILADPLQITHLGNANLIFSRPIIESEEAMSITINEGSTGTVTFQGINTYTGTTTVNGGKLRLLNGEAIEDTTSLAINGGIIEIEENETVGNLFIDGARKAPGVYGSTSSIAPEGNQDDTKFSGIGTITVVGLAIEGSLQILSISKTETQITLTWTSNPGETFSVFSSLDLVNFDNEIDDGIPAAVGSGVTEYTFPATLIDDPRKAFFKVARN